MLHLRVIVPPELTDIVGELLLREPGVATISVASGAGIDPVGDVLEADVEHAALSALISRLQKLHIDRIGSYAFSEAIDALSASADAARTASARVGADLISWDEVAARTRDHTVVTDAYLLLMTIAGRRAEPGIARRGAGGRRGRNDRIGPGEVRRDRRGAGLGHDDPGRRQRRRRAGARQRR